MWKGLLCALCSIRRSPFERDVVLDITLLHTVDFCRSFLSVTVFDIRGPPFCYGILKFKLTAFAGLSIANPTCLVRGQRCQRKREGSVRRIVSVTFNFNFADCGGHLLVETPEGRISFSPFLLTNLATISSIDSSISSDANLKAIEKNQQLHRSALLLLLKHGAVRPSYFMASDKTTSTSLKSI